MKGAIFDVDGTLLDSMTAWFKISERFFKRHNLAVTAEQTAEYKEMRLEDSLSIILKEYNLDMTVEEIIGEFRKMIAEEYRDNIPLKPHAGEYMKKLHSQGVKIAIATSGYESLCKSAFERLGVWKYIDARAFSNEVGKDKSNPDVYLLAAERIGVKPEECTVYEDIVLGITGAKKGGFMTCAVWDKTNEDETEILKSIADKYITDWSELF